MLRGTIQIDWRGTNLPVVLQYEVRAARAEGSCYLLCILDLILETYTRRHSDQGEPLTRNYMRHFKSDGKSFALWRPIVRRLACNK